jgi:hypothetical protein
MGIKRFAIIKRGIRRHPRAFKLFTMAVKNGVFMKTYEPIVAAAKEYFGSPMPFLYTMLIRFLVTLVTVFAACAIILAVAGVVSNIAQLRDYTLIILGATGIVLLVPVIYLSSGYRGAMIWCLLNAESGPVHMRDFLVYTRMHSKKFLAVNSINILASLIGLAVFAGAMVLLKPADLLVPALLALVVSLPVLAIRFIMTFGFMSIAVKNTTAVQAFTHSFRFMLRHPFRVFGIMLLYLFSVYMLFVPLFNLLSILLFYPMTYVLMIDTYKSSAY